MKANAIAVLGAILCFVAIVLPWWTFINSSSITQSYGYNGWETSAYLYQSTHVVTQTSQQDVYSADWYGWTTLALVLAGTITSLAGSVGSWKSKAFLLSGAVLTLAGTIIFPVALSLNLNNSWAREAGIPEGAGLFSSGSNQGGYGVTFSYSAYLSYGFWIALTGTILMLVAAVAIIIRSRPKVSAPDLKKAPAKSK